jgi:diguanylate cyclase (GGDEF)-like protein/PAS domain S-box-containing protein
MINSPSFEQASFLNVRIVPRVFTLSVCLTVLSGLMSLVQAQVPVSLQLKWSHAFQFAGYYAAQEKGYYREAGLQVDIREAKPGLDVVQTVLSGQATFGVGNSDLLLARQRGSPVVALGVIFQHSPLVLIARGNQATQSIHDLLGKRVMIEPQSDELVAFLKQEGLPAGRLTQVEHSHNPQDLIDGKVDAMSAYVTNEPYFLDHRGFDYQIYTPRSIGIDFYGDNLFTIEREIENSPARVEAFRTASLRGWQYAINHPEEIADLIISRYGGQHPREFYLFEAQRMQALMQTDLIHVGYMNPGRWRHIADTYAGLGLLPRDFAFDGFLYDPQPKVDLTRIYLLLALLAFGTLIVLYIMRNNRRLQRALTASQEDRRALAMSEERHRLLADHASDVIWTMDLAGRFTYVSPSVERLRGFTVAEVMQQRLDQALTPSSAKIAVDALGRAIQAIHTHQPIPDFRAELEQPCKQGGTVWTEVSVTGIQNKVGEFVNLLGVTRDITERRRLEDQLRQLAFFDTLTQLANRRLLIDRLDQAMAAGKRSGVHGAVMFLDLDHFKSLNDTHGHEFGDLLLREVAKRLTACVREIDTVARFGGDEFVVLLTALSADRAQSTTQAGIIAEKIRCKLGEPYLLKANPTDKEDATIEHHCSASIGVVLFDPSLASQDEILKWADAAMYQAKGAGRDAIRFHEEAASA